MTTFRDMLAANRERAERIANDPQAPEHAWAWPGEWWDVLELLEDVQLAIDDPPDPPERIAMLAFFAGEAWQRATLRPVLSPTLEVGDSVKRGGRKGAARKHGPHADREAKRATWRARFAELRTKFPEAPKKDLLGKIADETGETLRTLRRYIKQR